MNKKETEEGFRRKTARYEKDGVIKGRKKN